jgi:hypothetical protein
MMQTNGADKDDMIQDKNVLQVLVKQGLMTK